MTSVNEILDTYRDGRKCPRLVIACPVALSLADGPTVEATLYDISTTGLQVWIGIKEAGVLKIQPDNDIKKNATALGISFRLTIEGQVREIDLMAKPLHLKKIHDDYLAIGMQIINLDKKSTDVLEEYIESSLETG